MRDHSSADVNVLLDESERWPRRRADRLELQVAVADETRWRDDELQSSRGNSFDWHTTHAPAGAGAGERDRKASLTDLTPGSAYAIRARAINAAGPSSWLYSSSLLRIPPAPCVLFSISISVLFYSIHSRLILVLF